MPRHQEEAIDYQEGPPPTLALWGEGAGHSHCAEGRDAGGEQATSHLDEDQQKLLAAMESPVEKRAGVKNAAVRGRTGKAKPFATGYTGCSRRPSRPAGRRCGKRRKRGYPCEPSPGNWACFGWPPEDMPL